MAKTLTAIWVLLLMVSCGLRDENSDKDKQRIDNVCDKFMKTFSKGRYREALNLLKQNSVLESEKIDTLQAEIERQSVDVFPTFGKMLSSYFISERKIKWFIAKRFYILKFEKYPIKFEFTLYKSAQNWTITSFSYNEELDELYN